MAGYSYALSEEAVHIFADQPARPRSRLLRLFVELTRHPTQSGDYHESGGAGRTYELRLVDDVLITWWTDHAAREVRIVRLEIID